MGVRASIILCATSFLLGCFFTRWTVDHSILWTSPVTPDSIRIALAYYVDLLSAPAWMNGVIYAVAFVGVLAVGAKVAEGGVEGWLFDGASLFLYFSAISVFAVNVSQALFSLSHILTSASPTTTTTPSTSTSSQPPELPSTIDKPIIDLSSAHLIIAVALTGVLSLQGGRYYSGRVLENEIRERERELLSARGRELLERRERGEELDSGSGSGLEGKGKGKGKGSGDAVVAGSGGEDEKSLVPQGDEKKGGKKRKKNK